MRASGLITDGKIERAAGFVVAVRASRVEDIVELVILGNPAIGLAEAASQVVDAISTGEGKSPVGRMDQIGALRCRNGLIIHLDATTLDRVRGRRLAGVQIIPCIIRYIIRPSRSRCLRG